MFGSKWKPAKICDLTPAIQRDLKWDTGTSKTPNEADFSEYHFSQLSGDIFRICHRYFGQVNFHESRSPWARVSLGELRKYVESVAHPDILMGDWDGILRNDGEREMLACGIVGKVLDAQVFSNLLFGADPAHRAKLDEQDRALLDVEGFIRTRIRADLNKRYLNGTRGKPLLFWEEVDRVAVQLLCLLMPLYTLVGNKRRSQMPPLGELYQGLHDIVSHAGYIGVQTRISTSIYVYDWPKPGGTFVEGSEAACYSSFEASRERADEHDMQRGLPMGPWDRVSRVKIAVSPLITRHTSLDGADGPGVASYRLQRMRGVFFKGWRDRDRAKGDFVSLTEHVLRGRESSRSVPSVVPLLLLSLVGWWALSLVCDPKRQVVEAILALQELLMSKDLLARAHTGLTVS